MLSGWTVGSVPDALGAVAIDIQRASGLTEAAGVAGAARAPAGRFSGDPCAPAEAKAMVAARVLTGAGSAVTFHGQC